MKQPAFRIVLLASALVMGVLAAAPGAVGQEVFETPGTPSMSNLQHAFNDDWPAGPGDSIKGTDMAFWNADVPLRDENGEKVLDEDGNEIIVNKDFVAVGAYYTGARIYDITDPENASFIKQIDCRQIRNDPAILQHDGRVLLALAKDDFGGNLCGMPRRIGNNWNAGIAVFDLTDPWESAPMYSVQFQGGAHNFTFHPTKPFGWASNGDLPGALAPPALGKDMIPIVDFTDLDNPTVSQIETDLGSPHDLDFSLDGTRAYVANENHYLIYDTTDPEDPTLIAGPDSATATNPGTYAHGAFVTPDKSIMVTNNESLALGGFFAAGTGVCPGEGIAFYDVATDEAHPIPVGYWVPNVVGRTPDARACTSHFGNIAPNGEVITIGWYIAGSRVVDFSNPSVPVEVAHAVMEGGQSWSSKTYKGPYVYSADMNRGFDIFKWSGAGPAPWTA